MAAAVEGFAVAPPALEAEASPVADAPAESAAAAEAVAASVDLVLCVLAQCSPRSTHRAASACKSWSSSASPLLRHLSQSTFHPPYHKKWWSREMAAAATLS